MAEIIDILATQFLKREVAKAGGLGVEKCELPLPSVMDEGGVATLLSKHQDEKSVRCRFHLGDMDSIEVKGTS
jgi:hypothetical protein